MSNRVLPGSLASGRLSVVALLFGCAVMAGAESPALGQANCCPPPCGRVAWWPGNGSPADSLGNNDATLVGGVGYASGRHGAAFSLDGIDDRIDLGSAALVGGDQDPFTIAMWVRLAERPTSGDYVIFARLRHETQFLLGGANNLNIGGSYLAATFRGAIRQWWVPIDWSDFLDRWVHLAAVYTGGDKNAAASYRIYMNGQLLPQGHDPLGFVAGTNNDNGLGYDPFPGTGRTSLNGLIDDVQVFDRALSAAEIATAANHGACGIETGLWLSLSGRHQTRGGAESTYVVSYVNYGEQAIDRAVILVTSSANAEIRHSQPMAWSISEDASEAPADSVAFAVYDVQPGEGGSFPVRLRAWSGPGATLSASAWVVPFVGEFQSVMTGNASCRDQAALSEVAMVEPFADPPPPPGSVVFQFAPWNDSHGTGHMGIIYHDTLNRLEPPGRVWVWENLGPQGTHFTLWEDFSGRTGSGWQDYHTPALSPTEIDQLQQFMWIHSPADQHGGGQPFAFDIDSWHLCHWAVDQAFQSLGRTVIPGHPYDWLDSPGYIWYRLKNSWLPIAAPVFAIPHFLIDVAMAGILEVGVLRPLRPFIDIQVVIAWDPNEKIGKDGVGAQRYLRGDEAMQYMIMFENDAGVATAAARSVVIEDTLSSQTLDLHTFELGFVDIGEQHLTPPAGAKTWSTVVDLPGALAVAVAAALDTLSGVVRWEFATIDSVTGLPPEDPLVGFLPPNLVPPEGEGQVSYTVCPTSGLVTDTEIQNRASIVFDSNQPVITPTWTNLVDAEPPVSMVAALDSVQASATFDVTWHGTDNGAGGVLYSVFVSENGQPFSPWLVDVPDENAIFSGVLGSEYAFYSQGMDAVGHVEIAPVNPDAVTRVTGASHASDVPFTNRLIASYPNPFNPSTRIVYELAQAGMVNLDIFDLAGRSVCRLRHGAVETPGVHAVVWDGISDAGRALPSGAYVVRLQAPGFDGSAKILLVK